jgi:hypothetical protein
VKTKYPSVCAMVNCKVCKSTTIAVYCLCISVIKSECVTNDQ